MIFTKETSDDYKAFNKIPNKARLFGFAKTKQVKDRVF